jgi:hypothetical protein
MSKVSCMNNVSDNVDAVGLTVIIMTTTTKTATQVPNIISIIISIIVTHLRFRSTKI